MKKKIILGVILSSIGLMELTSITTVFSDDSLINQLQEWTETVSSETLDSSVIVNSMIEKNENVDNLKDSSFIQEEITVDSESIIEGTLEVQEDEDSSFHWNGEASSSGSFNEKDKMRNKLSVTTEKTINKYVTMFSKGISIWEDVTLSKMSTTSGSYFQQTLFVEKEFLLSNNTKVFSISDNRKILLGYVDANTVQIVGNEQGQFSNIEQFVTIRGTSPIWNDFSWEKRHPPMRYKNQTVKARGVYYHFNGTSYFSLYDSQNNWLGYINENGTHKVNGEQGLFHPSNKFVTLIGDYNIWADFSWSNSHSSTKFKNQTVKIQGEYYHYNGSRYFSLYDNKNNWLGYVNEKGTKESEGEQGAYFSINQFVTIKGTSPIWNNFNWTKSHSPSKYKYRTVKATGKYHHYNGVRYLSLHDDKNNWLGYINENGIEYASGEQGIYRNYKKYVTIKGTHDIWNGFAWENKESSNHYKGQTLQATGIYHHFNGARYLSLYDNTGGWIGYLNEDGASLAPGAQGIYQKLGKSVTIKSENYSIWRDFNWSSKASGNYLGKRYLAKGVYYHFNGTRYLSIYDNKGTWIGYINGHGTDDIYQYWSKNGGNWYYYFNNGKLAKGWKQIDGQWNFFDSKGVHVDNSQTKFIASNISDVLKVTKENKLYPSIMLAQSILESGYGTSELARKANNFFGIKFKENEDEGKYGIYYVKTQEYDSEKDEMITILAPFRKYSTEIQSFKDNALKLRQGVSWDKNYYQGTWRENSKNYKEVSKSLTGKYATDPNYYKKLNQVIEIWKLDQFD